MPRMPARCARLEPSAWRQAPEIYPGHDIFIQLMKRKNTLR
jgi:hypothetical protein